MVFVVRNLVQLVYVLVPCISHLEISQNVSEASSSTVTTIKKVIIPPEILLQQLF
jgi:hypothetical protein